MKLSSLFSDNMVIQRDAVQYIWGKTTPGTKITGSFGSSFFSGFSYDDGSFKVALPNLKAGGPYNLTIEADTKVTLTNVLVGDVFLLGGQSNMEYTMGMLIDRLGFNEVKEDEEYIRSFEVPKVYSFDKLREDLYDSHWVKAHGDDIRSFSAAGFYAAKKLYADHKVPVGLIHCAVGGTPAKSWCSQDTIRKMNLYVDELDKVLQKGYTEETEKKDNEIEAKWLNEASSTFSLKNNLAEGTVEVPVIWEEEPLKSLHGTVTLRHNFFLTKEMASMSLDAYLGTLRDQDTTYINGIKIGTTGYRYPTRRYHIPEGVLKEGENTIQMDIMVFRGKGGFDNGKDLFLCPEGTMKSIVDLKGKWNYEVKKHLEVLDDKTFFIYYPSGLYQGMLYPLRNYCIKAAMYYQGESNVCVHQNYKKEMDSLIADWRKLFEKSDLPFIQVQLAGYCDSNPLYNGEGWALLREKQREAAEGKNNYLVQAYDLGEFNDLHPQNKKDLGLRLALQAEAILYPGEDTRLGAMNPKALKAEEKDGFIKVYFTDTGKGIAETKEVHNIKLTLNDGSKVDAKAELSNNILSVKASGAREISYAWSDCAFDVNLYGVNGLPVVPFKIGIESN